MRLRQGDMFSYWQEYDMMLVTTNAMVRKDGALVMGRGAAKTATEIWPTFAMELGRIIKDHPNYGIIFTERSDDLRIGAFQVKYHWQDKADINLIIASTAKLRVLAEMFPDDKIALNFPGIGNGRLPRDMVYNQIRFLPDNIDVWEL